VLGVHPDDSEIVSVNLDERAIWDHCLTPSEGPEEG